MPVPRSTSDQRDGSAHAAAGGDGVKASKATAALAAPAALAANAINESPATYQLVRASRRERRLQGVRVSRPASCAPACCNLV